MPKVGNYSRYGHTSLSPLEREIRDLLRQAEVMALNNPGDVENAQKLAASLKDYAAQARDASFPYTARLLRAAQAGIELRLSRVQDGNGTTTPDAI